MNRTVLTSAARTASGDASFDVPDGAIALLAQLDVTAVSGTAPTLDVVIEDSLDGVNYDEVQAFTQRTAAGRQRVAITTPISQRARVRWTIAGTTPSFTFSLIVESARR